MAAASEAFSGTIPLSVFEKIKTKTYSRETSYIEEHTKLESVLDRYLQDIIADISREIDNISDFQRNSIVVAKKNPRLLSKYINKDTNINLIKCEINKLAPTNFSIILETVVNIMNTVDADKVETYIDLIFTVLTNKCYLEDNNIALYINFIYEIGKLEKYQNIIKRFESYLENIFAICSGEINWQPCIKTESGINIKPEYFTTVGRILAELLKMQKYSVQILKSIYDNLVLTNMHTNMHTNMQTDMHTDTSQEKRVLIIIGFSQIPDIDRFIPQENYKSIGIEMHKIIESKLPYKFKYRLMDWYDTIKKKVKIDAIPIAIDEVASSKVAESIAKPQQSQQSQQSQQLKLKLSTDIIPSVEEQPISTQLARDEPQQQQHITLHTRITSLIRRDINSLTDESIISKTCKFLDKFADTEEISADISNVYTLLMEKLNENPKNINIITDFITIIGSKYENIWTEDIDNYFTELAHFNSININWYSNGIFIAGLITNKLIGYSEIKNLILVNKKDINKIVEIKFRIISGINSIGVKNLIKILPGANNKKYLANLNAIISRINSINSSNSLLNNAREFSKTLTKELTTKSANRFELLQEMMSEL